MPVFTYRGTNRAGDSVSGELAAASKMELINNLKRQQINVTKMSEKGKEFNLPTFGGGVDSKELAVFTRQFSVMIDAGLPLVQCLEILAGQQENKMFQKVLTGTRAAVEGGSTLSAAMRQYDKVFDALYVNLVEAGETGGILDTILQRLSLYIEKNVKLKRAVKSALVYPIAVLSVAAGVIVLLLWKVVPIFATLFLGLGVELPLPTRIVIGLSNFVGSIFGFLILVAVVAGIVLQRAGRERTAGAAFAFALLGKYSFVFAAPWFALRGARTYAGTEGLLEFQDAMVLAGEELVKLLHLADVRGRGLIAEPVFQQGNRELRVIGAAVIALTIVFHRELPVAFFNGVGLECHL